MLKLKTVSEQKYPDNVDSSVVTDVLFWIESLVFPSALSTGFSKSSEDLSKSSKILRNSKSWLSRFSDVHNTLEVLPDKKVSVQILGRDNVSWGLLELSLKRFSNIDVKLIPSLFLCGTPFTLVSSFQRLSL